MSKSKKGMSGNIFVLVVTRKTDGQHITGMETRGTYVWVSALRSRNQRLPQER